jgi:hypothetical protein
LIAVLEIKEGTLEPKHIVAVCRKYLNTIALADEKPEPHLLILNMS